MLKEIEQRTEAPTAVYVRNRIIAKEMEGNELPPGA
jgi:hypothetical protein